MKLFIFIKLITLSFSLISCSSIPNNNSRNLASNRPYESTTTFTNVGRYGIYNYLCTATQQNGGIVEDTQFAKSPEEALQIFLNSYFTMSSQKKIQLRYEKSKYSKNPTNNNDWSSSCNSNNL